MSTIYSAGQYDDAFSPKRLGNWETGAKEARFKLHQFYPGTKTEIIADSRGHLLPWVPRDKSRTWGLLNYYKHCTLAGSQKRNIVGNCAMPADQQQQGGSQFSTKKTKLPKYTPKRQEPGIGTDLLLEYLQDLSLPIIWIIGPPTKHTSLTRKQFCKRLAASLGFSYINLDEKILEWKERQTTCTCGSNIPCSAVSSACSHGAQNPARISNSLASTSIAPSKLPTNVPHRITPDLPAPPFTRADSSIYELYSLLETQRITFDTALPLDRHKILELYKFAMSEGLPCGGFVMDAVPFDLLEGIAFEKIFYPAALAIYFTEGVPFKKSLKPKDRRVTACTASTDSKKILTPMEYLEKRRKDEYVYLRTKYHKRLGNFSLGEGEKICKQYGSKTIRIINAEDVEKDTMDFLNQLVKKNLEKHQQMMDGRTENVIDTGGAGDMKYQHQSAGLVIPEKTKINKDALFVDDLPIKVTTTFLYDKKEGLRDNYQAMPNSPPALVTAVDSDTSVFTVPNIFSETSISSHSLPESVLGPNCWEKDGHIATLHQLSPPKTPLDTLGGGGGDSLFRQRSAHLWEKISKLESKVAEVNPEEDSRSDIIQYPTYNETDTAATNSLPPPTAYAEENSIFPQEKVISSHSYNNKDFCDEVSLTNAIRNAIVPGYTQSTTPVEYDYGAGGDCPILSKTLPSTNCQDENHPCDKSSKEPTLKKASPGPTRQKSSLNTDTICIHNNDDESS